MSIKKSLNKFGKAVVKESRTQLTKQKKNASKDLYNTLDYNVKVSKNSFELSFEMMDYGAYINDGVKGTKENRVKGGGLKLGGSKKFAYKDGIENKPSYKHFEKWIKRKGIQGRSKKTGRFITKRSAAEAVSYSVWTKGLKTTNFFTRPFELAFKNLPEQLVEAFGLEVDKLLKLTT
jgi:hypothetical protein